jgi:hypothetical protein
VLHHPALAVRALACVEESSAYPARQRELSYSKGLRGAAMGQRDRSGLPQQASMDLLRAATQAGVTALSFQPERNNSAEKVNNLFSLTRH